MSTQTQNPDESHSNTKVQDLQHSKAPVLKEDRKCSWCGEVSDHKRITHHLAAKRSKYQCSKCLKCTVRCRNPRCDTMARAHRGWHEGFCIDHTPLYNERSVSAYCSWCFKETSHTIQNDSLLNRMTHHGKVFACDKCHRATQHCKKCDVAMCRVSERGSTSQCFSCCGLISSWIDPKACHQAMTVNAWCPWCASHGEHEVKIHFKGKEIKKDIFQCKGCATETTKCECGRSMICHSTKDNDSKCVLCKEKKGEEYWQLIHQKYSALCDAYTIEVAKADMDRQSSERDRALEAGLLRPFQLLVSMHPEMRSGTAFKLEIPLLQEDCLGNAHKEADLILFQKKRGLQRRTNSIFESIGVSTKCNWYMILRRAIHDLADTESSFKSKKAKETFEECADPSSEVLNALEFELLDHLARRQIMMLSEDLRSKAIEMYDNDEVYHMFDELHMEGTETDSICIAFLAIALSTGVQEGKLGMDVNKVKLDSFINYLRSYLHGSSASGDRIRKAQFAGTQIAFFIARIIVVGTLVQVVSAAVFPPIAPFVSAVLFPVGVGLFIASFLFKPSREVACQATLVIVFQHFLLSTSGIQVPSE